MLVNMFINSKSENVGRFHLFKKITIDDKYLSVSPFNMDLIRMELIHHIPPLLKGNTYSISVNNKLHKTNIDVYFEYNKDIIRDLKIDKVLND